MGKDWIKALGVTFKLADIHSVEDSNSLHEVLKSIPQCLVISWGA